MFGTSVTMNLSQRIGEHLVHLPAPVTFILSQLGWNIDRIFVPSISWMSKLLMWVWTALSRNGKLNGISTIARCGLRSVTFASTTISSVRFGSMMERVE